MKRLWARILIFLIATSTIALGLSALWNQDFPVDKAGWSSHTIAGKIEGLLHGDSTQTTTGRKVAFLVAGVQKGGTTALHEYLSLHPYLTVPANKELHFFDNDAVDWSVPDYTKYEEGIHLFNTTLPTGEATPIYIYWPGCLERIKQYNPAIKLILIFRDPVSRAWSHWKMAIRVSAETEPFSWAIRDGRARFAATVDNTTATEDTIITTAPAGYHRWYSYVERGFYGEQLENVYRHFPKSNVLLLKSEELRKGHEDVMRRISNFLGVPQPDVPLPQLNSFMDETGRKIAREDEAYLRDLFREDLMKFAATSGLDVADWL